MQDSPYFSGGFTGFGPPGGLAGLIQQDRQIATSGANGWKELADVAEKYKQQQLEGKAADATVAAYPDMLAAAGVHPEQWKTLGAREKSAVVKGVVQAQAQQGVMQQFAEQAQQMRLRQQMIDANAAFGQTMKDAQGAAAMDTLKQGNGPVKPRAMTMQDFAAAAERNPNAWTAPNARPLLEDFAKLAGKDKRLTFTTSPTGATIAISPDTGAFQYDPYSKAAAESGVLSTKDALKAYNDNQERINTLQTRLKMAQDPKNADLPFDADALQAELEDLKAQQPELRSKAGLKAGTGKPAANSPASAPGKRKRYNPATGKIETY